MTTKARKIRSNPRGDRRRCVICTPRRGEIREDQVWGRCPTNRKHKAHR